MVGAGLVPAQPVFALNIRANVHPPIGDPPIGHPQGVPLPDVEYPMTKYDPHKHHRRSIRLKGYDYTQAGVYFVTICVQGGLCLLGNIVDGEMICNPAGDMVHKTWHDLPDRYPHIELDAFIVMPNHVHGIIVITGDHIGDSETGMGHGKPTLGRIIGAYKSISTNGYIRGVKQDDWEPFPGRFWQRNYYERIIRNERALNAIRQYIAGNPASWPDDQLHPDAPPNPFNKYRNAK